MCCGASIFAALGWCQSTHNTPPYSSGQAEGAEPGLVIVRNLRWPGSATIGVGKRFANVYVGYGHRYQAAAYAPPVPADVATEWAPEEDAPPLTEQADVTEDPDAGQPEGEGDGEEED